MYTVKMMWLKFGSMFVVWLFPLITVLADTLSFKYNIYFLFFQTSSLGLIPFNLNWPFYFLIPNVYLLGAITMKSHCSGAKVL